MIKSKSEIKKMTGFEPFLGDMVYMRSPDKYRVSDSSSTRIGTDEFGGLSLFNKINGKWIKQELIKKTGWTIVDMTESFCIMVAT